MKFAAASFALLILALIALPLSSAHSPQLSNEVYAFSSQSKAKQSLYLEGNQSGMEMFKNWSIVIEGKGNYEVVENGSVLAKGYSSSSMVIPEIFNVSKVSVEVFFNGVKYSFDNITIVNFLSSKSLISVSVSSYMPHQSQFLTVQPGQSHALMYQDWIAYFSTSKNESFTITDNGHTLTSGYVQGSKSVDFNVSKGGASVIIKIGGKSYSYPQELIATVPLQQYYGHTAPKAQFTLSEYIDFGIHVLTDASIGLLFAILTVGAWVISRKNRRVMQMR